VNRAEWQEELERDLAELRARNQLREFAQLQGVNFCSNDYLGLAEDSRLRLAVLEAVEKSTRVGGTGSRLLSGHDPVWNELEEEFAAFAGTEAALYFSSGYAANIGLLTAVLGSDDVVFSDALNHASLIDGIRLSGARKEIYPHRDVNYLEGALRLHEGESCRKLIVTESVFSMDGGIADLRAMQNLGERYGASLIVDEAHATAVHGPDGAGIVAEARLTDEVFATVHTCGKALASTGAFVCGSRVLREFLMNHARTLIFSTAMPIYMAGQIRAALRLARNMNAERARLLANAAALMNALGSDGWDIGGSMSSPIPQGLKPHFVGSSYVGAKAPTPEVPVSSSQIVPLIVGANEDAVAAAGFLQGRGFAVRAIRPPTVPFGSARLRLSLTTRITHEHVAAVFAALKSWRASRMSVALAGYS
jgi:8-amino-7-oxononanoate synthase